MAPRTDKHRARQRGSTLTGYALTVAAFTGVSIAAIVELETSSQQFLDNTASDIGTARPFVAELDDKVFDAPVGWQPPVPITTTTTTAPTTSSTAAPTTSSTAPTTSSTAAPTTSTTAPTTTSTAPTTSTTTAGLLTVSGADATNVTGAFAPVVDGVIGADNGTGSSFDGPGTALGSATFTFTVTEAGDYKIKGSVQATDGEDDSFWVTIGGADHAWGTAKSPDFIDDFVNQDNGGADVVVFLEPGEHVVVVSVREDGTRLQSLALERQ